MMVNIRKPAGLTRHVATKHITFSGWNVIISSQLCSPLHKNASQTCDFLPLWHVDGIHMSALFQLDMSLFITVFLSRAGMFSAHLFAIVLENVYFFTPLPSTWGVYTLYQGIHVLVTYIHMDKPLSNIFI